MSAQNISQIIRDLFRQNFNLYPELYPLTEAGLMSEEGTTNAQDAAKGYWDMRNEDEAERDEKAGVTEIDYLKWVMAELSDLIPAAPNKFQTWATEINKDWTDGYKAEATEDALSVNFNSEEIGRIDYNNGRYTVTGTDKEAVEQLEYMTNR